MAVELPCTHPNCTYGVEGAKYKTPALEFEYALKMLDRHRTDSHAVRGGGNGVWMLYGQLGFTVTFGGIGAGKLWCTKMGFGKCTGWNVELWIMFGGGPMRVCLVGGVGRLKL